MARTGTDVTLVAWGAMVPLCERVADDLAGEASVEVLDLRSLKPLDEEAVLASVRRTGRCVVVQEAPRTCGFASEIAALLAERAILDLHGPVLRVTGFDVPYPYWQLEDWYMPSVDRVVGRRAPRAGVLSASRRYDVSSAWAIRACSKPARRQSRRTSSHAPAATTWKHVSSSGRNVVRR